MFVHGIPTGPALWRKVLPSVDAYCLAFEMVGYADSIPAGRDHDIAVGTQADYLLAWLSQIGVDRALFVGHDIGGGVAQIAAVRAPERCAGPVLTNTIAYDSWPIPSVKALRTVAPLFARLPGAAAYPVMAMLFPRGHDDLHRAREALAIHWRPYRRHGGARALARQVASLDTQDTLAVADRLQKIDVPVQVVWGAADQFQRLHYGRRLADDFDGELTAIENGRHFMPEDHPDEIALAITKVLGRVAA